jgi:hypothetical protein
MLDRVHDLSGSIAQIALSDLGLDGHSATLPACATRCYRVTRGRADTQSGRVHH